MKLLSLTLLVGLAAALEFSELDSRQIQHRPHKNTTRPEAFDGISIMAAASKPKGAPAEYTTSTGRATLKKSKANLKKLPAELIDDHKHRRDSRQTLRRLRRASASPADFYECSGSGGSDADCQVVIDQVYASSETLVVNANACLTFNYKSCTGFFCSLCETLSTTLDFVGNQLDSAEALCVADGFDGTVVGEDAPQWEAGFVKAGEALPAYDVC